MRKPQSGCALHRWEGKAAGESASTGWAAERHQEDEHAGIRQAVIHGALARRSCLPSCLLPPAAARFAATALTPLRPGLLKVFVAVLRRGRAGKRQCSERLHPTTVQIPAALLLKWSEPTSPKQRVANHGMVATKQGEWQPSPCQKAPRARYAQAQWATAPKHVQPEACFKQPHSHQPLCRRLVAGGAWPSAILPHPLP